MLLGGMIGLHGLGAVAGTLAPHGDQVTGPYVASLRDCIGLMIGFTIVWAFPNTQQVLLNFKPALEVTKADLGTNFSLFSGTQM